MKKIFFAVIILGLFSCGCEKKAKVDETMMEGQQVLSEIVIPPAEPVSTGAADQSVTQQVVAVSKPVSEPVAPTIYTEPTSKEIQQALKNANLYTGRIDGKIGPRSKKAIHDFQSQNSLKPDGKVGPRTWEKLQPFLNLAPSGVATIAD